MYKREKKDYKKEKKLYKKVGVLFIIISIFFIVMGVKVDAKENGLELKEFDIYFGSSINGFNLEKTNEMAG